MKVCYIASGLIPSATAHAVQMLAMCDALGSLGHQVTLISALHRNAAITKAQRVKLAETFDLRSPPRLLYAPQVRVAGRLGGSFHYTAAAVALAMRPDLIMTRDPRVALLIARLGKPVLLESHTLPVTPKARAAVRALCDSRSLVRWVFISKELQRLYGELWPLPRERTTIEHDGISLRRLDQQPSKGAARQRLHLPLERPIIVHSGSLYPGRVETLLDAARKLPDALFVFVGGSSKDVARLRRERQPGDNVLFAGHQAPYEVPNYLAAADVLVIASGSSATTSDRSTVHVQYSSPMKLFEYMAAHRPIVATRFPSIEEVIEHDVSGLLVPPDDPQELVRTLQLALSSGEVCERLANNALARVAAFTWEKRAGRILHGVGPWGERDLPSGGAPEGRNGTA